MIKIVPKYTIKMDDLLQHILTQGEEGNIYIGNYNGCQVIIKENTSCNSCLTYEYLIGKEINKLNNDLPFFAQTIDLIYHEGCKYLIVEYIKGMTLEDFLREEKIDTPQFYTLILFILCVLKTAQERIGFNHNDLHLRNIIVFPLNEPQPFTFTFTEGDTINFTTQFSFKLIDFGASRVDNMKDIIPEGTFWEGGLERVSTGIVPSLNDPVGDLMMTLGHLSLTDQFIDLFNSLAQETHRLPKIPVPHDEPELSGRINLIDSNLLGKIRDLPITINRSPIIYVDNEVNQQDIDIDSLLNESNRERERLKDIGIKHNIPPSKSGLMLLNAKYCEKVPLENDPLSQMIHDLILKFNYPVYCLLYRLKYDCIKKTTLKPRDIVMKVYNLVNSVSDSTTNA